MEKRKIYDRNFKVKAIQLGSERGVRKASRELDIAPSLITIWRQELLKYGTASFCGIGKSRLTPEEKIFSKQKIKLKRELKQSELKIEIFKNGSKYVSQGKLMTYHFIENNVEKYTLGKICKVFGVNRNAYIKWKKQVISPTQRRTNLLKEEITSIFFEYKEIYGSARIAAELQSRGFTTKQRQVAKYMKELGLVSKIRRNYKIKTVSRYNRCAFPNILNQQFTVEEPSKAWVSGITRIQTKKRVLFLTIIMDLFDRKIIGWSLSNGLTVKETTIPAWEMAVQNRKTKTGLIFHSDRGIQYSNNMLSSKIDSYKFIRRSMNRKGNHSDNSICESFFTSLKSELVDLNILLPKEQMEQKIFEYLGNLH
ncbi:IS3 family transposase [Flavobacterium aquariorum]|uniref:IS3 family transposase n=1 Tax=Flavobacterium aquariorum TaxID=2217670 RepID=A0A2W7TRW4_9FLAO|nr:IS3 family transposase [Flavobacterium aquariorum]PZX92798.1 IS3 family transposase [Flavobacterium aquariorum]